MSPDSRALIYHVGASRQALDAAEQVADDEGVLVDGSVDIEQPISRGAWRDGHLASERFTGNWFARGDLLWRAPVREVRVAIADGHGSIAAAAPKKAFSPTFARIDDRWQLSLKRPEGATIRCDISACRVGTPVAAVPLDDGEHVLVTTEDTAQAERLSLWRPDTGQAVNLRQSDGLLSGDRRDDTPCAIAKRMAVCVAASANAPPRLVTIDLASGRMVTLMDPNASLRTTIGTPVRRLDWKSPLGTPFTAQLILPRGALPSTGVPLFITYYDCPGFLRGGLGDEYPMLPLANAGIAALCINKPHTPSDQRDASWDYDQARAGITTIVAQLAREGVVDPHHVGMGGLSFGGEITMVMAMQTRLLAAASISTMQLEPTFYWANTIGDRDTAKSMRATWNVGDPDGDATGWKRISPALNVEQIRVPLLMQMPEQEARSSIELIAKLSQSNVPNETIAYAHEAHLKRLPRHKEATYQRNLDWFRFWLQGYVDPDPAKADQYRRWSSMAARWHHDQGLDRAHP